MYLRLKLIHMRIKKNKKNKKSKKNNFSFGRTSIFAVSVFFFLAIIMVGSAIMSEAVLERYAKVQIAGAKILSDRKVSLLSKEFQGNISIGEGVAMSESCEVSNRSVVCKDM